MMRRALCAASLALAVALPARAQDSYVELQRFSGVLNHVRLNYVEDVGYDELVRGAIEGALATLDPHSSFLARADWQRMDALERGELATVGVFLEEVGGRIVVRSLETDGPAQRAGVMPGDRVVDVDGITTQGQQPHQVELALAGEEGEHIAVRLERGPLLDPVEYSVRLRREFPEERSVTHAAMLDGGIGYVALTGFGEEAARELDRALRDLRDEDARGAILDLRGNPGGLVTQAADAAALFLRDDLLIFRTSGRKADANEDYVTDSNGRHRELPLVVLIDDASASAAEALAATLQDHDRALIAGRRSFGKALVQAPFFLQGGDVVWLTIARLESPSGRVIQRPYDGRRIEEYHADAGTAADEAPAFRTDAGRTVRGGGGVRPDVELPAPAELPVWWAAALDGGHASAVADSVAHAGGDVAWLADAEPRDVRLVAPLIERVRAAFDIEAAATAAQRERLGLLLAERVVATKDGAPASVAFRLRHDADVRAATGLFAGMEERLAGSR